MPISLVAQDISDETASNLNQLILTGNNRHASDFCEIVSETKDDVDSIEELPETIQILIDDYIASRTFTSNDLTKKEVLFKLKYETFKICKDYKDALISDSQINPTVYQFLFAMENGKDITSFLAQQEDCGKIANIQNSIKMISENVFMDLSDMESDDESYKIRYFKFHPRDRKEGEILKSAENLVAELRFTLKDSAINNSIDNIDFNSDSKLFKILHKNYSQPVLNVPMPEPVNR